MIAPFVAATFLSACDPVGETYEAIGLRQDPEGSVVIRYALCLNERIERVELWNHKAPIVGDADDTLMWKIRARPAVAQGSFVVGSRPPGFRMGRR